MAKWKPKVELERRQVVDHLESLELYLVQGIDVSDLIDKLQGIIETHGIAHQELFIDLDGNSCGGCGGSNELEIKGKRLENDEEYNARIHAEKTHLKEWERLEAIREKKRARNAREVAKLRKQQDTDRRKLYEQLKAEFEPKKSKAKK